MPINSKFWNYFDQIASPKLAVREKTFRKIFNHLDKFDGPIIIVETGCARLENNWSGDGQSTIMFDKYINFRDQDSQLFTVDINLNNVTECKRLTSNRTQVHCDDSVHYLNDLSLQLQENKQFISFLYLDSFDLDEHYWFQSAAHHLKELASVMRCINKNTLVVVDDCPLNANFIPTTDNQLALIGAASIGGKGRLIAEYASVVGAKLEFAEYQAGWTGF
jgi:hypothetical protein